MGRRREPDPEGYAEELAAALKSERAEVASGRVTIKRHLRTILNESGWEKRSDQNVALIKSALTDAGVYPDLDIGNVEIDLGSWVTLSDTPFAPRTLGRLMVTESALNRFLTKYYESVFAEIDELRDLELVGSEKRIRYEGHTKKVDLVYQDPDGTLVGVELERGDPQENSAFQLRGYLDALAARGDPVRGVLITARPRSAQLEEDVRQELSEVEYPTAWYWYDASVSCKGSTSEHVRPPSGRYQIRSVLDQVYRRRSRGPSDRLFRETGS